MKTPATEQALTTPFTPEQGAPVGCYVYCVVPCGHEGRLGPIGIEQAHLYTAVQRDLGAVLHRCAAEPFQGKDPQTIATWALAHHSVVEAAWRRWGTVLPLAFNTIVRADGANEPEESVRAWLAAEYPSLKGKLEALAGKAEYGVQVFWDRASVSERLTQASAELHGLQERLQDLSRGSAYMQGQRLERLLKRELEAWAQGQLHALYARVSPWLSGIRMGKVKTSPQGTSMLMNLTCLASQEQWARLEAQINDASREAGLAVRLVGPLPPYSFC